MLSWIRLLIAGLIVSIIPSLLLSSAVGHILRSLANQASILLLRRGAGRAAITPFSVDQLQQSNTAINVTMARRLPVYFLGHGGPNVFGSENHRLFEMLC
jgi:hypothetical protein